MHSDIVIRQLESMPNVPRNCGSGCQAVGGSTVVLPKGTSIVSTSVVSQEMDVAVWEMEVSELSLVYPVQLASSTCGLVARWRALPDTVHAQPPQVSSPSTLHIPTPYLSRICNQLRALRRPATIGCKQDLNGHAGPIVERVSQA